MDIETAWLNIDEEHKLHILMDCGLRIKPGVPGPKALRASKQTWEELHHTIREGLKRKAIAGQIFL